MGRIADTERKCRVQRMKRIRGTIQPPHPRIIFVLAVVLTVVVGVLAGIPPATPAGAAGSFIVYDSTGRTGTSLDLLSNTSYPDLGLVNFDNTISSISVSGGEMVSLYTEPNFSGTCMTLVASEDNFATLNVGDNTVSSIRTTEGCRGPSSAYVRLHHNSSAYVTGINIYENTPDLRPLGANDEASEITLYNVNAAAVYSDINYGGRCETIIPRNQGSLAGTTIGNDAISSIRVNWTCLGPVRQIPVVTDLKVISNGSNVTDCGSTYTRRQKDLNDNAGGDYIYLCIQYGPFRAGQAFESDLSVITYTPGMQWMRNGDCSSDNGVDLIDTDLNAGAGGSYVYFCVIPGSPGTTALRDVDFVSYDDLIDALGADTTEDCKWFMGDQSNTEWEGANLNSDAGGDYIQTCKVIYGTSQDSTDPYLQLPGNITAYLPHTGGESVFVPIRTSAYSATGGPLSPNCSSSLPIDSDQTGAPMELPLGTYTVNCSASDGGRSASGSFQISVLSPPDLIQPTITASATSNGVAYAGGNWTRYDVVVTFSCTDNQGGSGVKSVTSPITISTDGTNQSATGTCVDNADNSASTTFSNIMVDKTAPSITPTVDPTANPAGWHNATVTVSFSCDDAQLLATCSQPVILTNDGANQSVEGIATDVAGNEQRITVSPINIDTTKPTITVSDIVQEATGPDGAAVSFTPGTLDATSGIDSTTCTDANMTTVVSGGTFALGTTLVTCTTTDVAGNSQSASFSILVRDTTAPVVTTPDAIEVNATGPRGAIVTFSTSATDIVTADLRVTCTPLESGGVFRVGTTDVTCRATDANGNTGDADFPVTVVVVSAYDVQAVDLASVGSKRSLWLVTTGEERLSMSAANRVCRDAGLESAIGIERYRYQGERYTRVTCAGAASLAR